MRSNAMFDDSYLASARPDCMLRAGRGNTSIAEGAYGDRMARCFRLQQAPWMASRSFATSQFAATRVVHDLGVPGFCETIEPERGFLLHVHLNGTESWETWRDGRKLSSHRYEKGSIGVHDLRQSIRWRVDGPIDLLSLYLPLEALNEVADEIGGTHIEALTRTGGAFDPVLVGLGAAILQVLEHSGRMNQLFFDQLALATGTHVLRSYGGIQEKMQRTRGALSVAQERRATELLASQLDGELSMADIARACGLSRAHFAA